MTTATILSDGVRRKRTLLFCPMGQHRGHFELRRHGDGWGCDECIRLAARRFVGLAIAQGVGR
jgi:hypothetical protein